MSVYKHDDVELWYETQGQGKRNFVLIHNAGGNHLFLDEQFKYVSKLGKALTLDLRGHGQSSKPESGYGFETLVEDIEALCSENCMEKVIVIGLNIGANLALDFALSTNRVSGLVLIEPPMVMNKKSIRMLKNELDDISKENKENIPKKIVDELIFRSTPEKEVIAIKAFQDSSLSARKEMYEYLLRENKSYSKKLKKVRLPILVIQSNSPLAAKEDLLNECSQILYGRVVGSGPWPTIEVPGQVNAMIERFIQFHIATL